MGSGGGDGEGIEGWGGRGVVAMVGRVGWGGRGGVEGIKKCFSRGFKKWMFGCLVAVSLTCS